MPEVDIAQKFYPRWIPQLNSEKETLVKSAEEHQRINPEDYQAMLEDVPPTPVTIQEHIDRALAEEQLSHKDAVERAVVDERERCAQIAMAAGGRNGLRIAAVIRGGSADSVVEESAGE